MVSRVILLVVLPLIAQAQRSLTHADYDAWRSIANPKLSDNGRYLAYAVFPQAGDGEIVIREISGTREIRVPAGQRPEPPAPDFGSEEQPPPPSVNAQFLGEDWMVATVFPTASDLAQAKREKKKPADMPKNGAVLVHLSDGAITRFDNVKSVQTPETGSRTLAVLKNNGELLFRSPADGEESVFADAAEFKLSPSGDRLVFTDKKGLHTVTEPGGSITTLMAASGKYAKLASDENGSRYAVIRDKELILWTVGDASATSIASNAAAVGALSFSPDGSRLFYGTEPRESASAPRPGDDEAVYDLWHYRDDFIQPMQKVRARRDRELNFRAAYLISEKKTVPLADTTLPTVTVSRPGTTAIGVDDRAYRRSVDHLGAQFGDVYFVDPATGARRLLEKNVRGTPSLSPDGRHALMFRDQQWIAFDLQTGDRRNLTQITGRAFHREDDDHPDDAPAYGPPQFTTDSRSVLLYDKYDIWLFALDGSLARNLTDGEGRREEVQFRLVNLAADPRRPGVDPAKPLLLRALHLSTKESGFWSDSFAASDQPVRRVMSARSYSVPVAAKNTDVLALTVGDFRTYPELHITNLSFGELKPVSNIHPELTKTFAWGSSEVMKFRNADGVELSAGLFKPANYDPAKKYPMIVYIYERLSDGVFGFTDPAPSHRINVSYYTSNGYVVLMPDIVYTIGYPGASALKCVLPAVQKAIELGLADPARVGIQGHSWGGYQIAYMVTQTNIFRAAAPGALVANMISAYDGIRWGPGLPRQFQYEHTQSRIGGTPWEYPMRFIENSPIFMADRVRTPLLMLHNDADDAVPWYQGIEFFLALRRLGKEVYFFNYNGEPHGVRKRPNQKDYTVRMQQFFDHYLKDAPKPAWMERGRPYLEKEPPLPAAAPSDHDR
jgi:dipeptidyl aminopeptidase/acylaminoacyl peptidase